MTYCAYLPIFIILYLMINHALKYWLNMTTTSHGKIIAACFAFIAVIGMDKIVTFQSFKGNFTLVCIIAIIYAILAIVIMLDCLIRMLRELIAFWKYRRNEERAGTFNSIAKSIRDFWRKD